MVPTACAPVEVPAAAIGETDEAIARHCAAYIGDGCVIQTGVGAVPEAILRQLHDRKDLGVHSGMLGDGLVDLVEAGVITNARKEIDRGVSINGALIGTSRLYRWADRNPAMRMTPASYTHDAGVLSQLSRLVTINSALEVAPHDAEIGAVIAARLAELEAFFHRCVIAGQRDGSITAAPSARDLARLLLTTVMGLRVLSRARPEPALLRGAARQALTLLDPPACAN